jgi:hypothetical protein
MECPTKTISLPTLPSLTPSDLCELSTASRPDHFRTFAVQFEDTEL